MVDYIKLFDKIIKFINWNTLKHTAFKLSTDNKVSKILTKDYLKSTIYHHIFQKDNLSFGISMSSKLKATVARVSLSILS